jgi:hypothetical protein
MSWTLEDAAHNAWNGFGHQDWTPAGGAPAPGEICLVAIVGSSSLGTVTPPAGFVQRGTTFTLGGGEIMSVWTKVAGASEPTTYTWVFTGSPYPTGATGIVLSGQDPTAPLEVIVNWVNLGSGPPAGAWLVPSVTTLSDGALNVFYVDDRLGGPGFTCDSGYVELIDQGDGAWYAKEITTAGPSGTKTVTVINGFACDIFQFSLKADAAAVPPPPPPPAVSLTLKHRQNTRPALFAPGKKR